MAQIDIDRNHGDVEFVPTPLIVPAGENVFWRNLDPGAEHWITKLDAPANLWFDAPLARFVEGETPDTSSRMISFMTSDTYVCSLDGHEAERGEVTVD